MATTEELRLIRKYDEMLEEARPEAIKKGEAINIFEGWSDQRKVFYMRGFRVKLPEATESPGLQASKDNQRVVVPDSVLCDITHDTTARENYRSSVGHYLSWHYDESDLRLEFGSAKRRSFVTRPFGTFVWYFRDQDYVVGLILDGQTGYVYGCITRVYRDGVLQRENVLLFNTETRANKDYIKGEGFHRLTFSGSYTEGPKIYNVSLGAPVLRKVIKKIACFQPKVDKVEPDPILFETLILYAAEASRIRGVFKITSRSLSTEELNNEGLVVIKIPDSEEPFVLNYRQLSSCALDFLHTKTFKRVTGTTPRNLYQILSSVLLLRRKNVYPTQFLMPNAPHEDDPNEPHQGREGQQLTSEEKLELLNEKGTVYSALLHGGELSYKSEDWIINLWEEDDSEKVDVWSSDGSNLNSIIEHAQVNMEFMALIKINNSFNQMMYGANNWWGKYNQKLADNAILAMSLAICEINTSIIKRISLYQHVARQSSLPVPECSHAGNKLTMKELMIRSSAMKPKEALGMGIKCYHSMEENKEGFEPLKTATKKVQCTDKASTGKYDASELTYGLSSEANENGSITGSSKAMKKLVRDGWVVMPCHRRTMEEPIDTYDGGSGETLHGDGSADWRMDPKQVGLETMVLQQELNLLHQVLRKKLGSCIIKKRENEGITIEELEIWVYGLHSTKKSMLKAAGEILLEKEIVQKSGFLHVGITGPNGILVQSH